MDTQAAAYMLFGIALVALFAFIIAHYYSRKRKQHVEKVKYKMLDDDE